ncbi:MAG: hypothetical protein P8L30_16715 [Longimicrobiales bacterium]|nr:hypothetical protein [Longimicrobiales bacterium]
MEDHADRQCGLDRNVTVGALAARFALGRNSPGFERIIRKPDGQVTTLLQAGFVLWPVPHPVLRLRMLVLAALRVLHGASLQIRGFTSQRNLEQEPCTNATTTPPSVAPSHAQRSGSVSARPELRA